MKKSISVFFAILFVISACLPVFSQEEKPELTYKGIPLRISDFQLREFLANKKLVPYHEIDSTVTDNNECGIIYQFEDNFAGYPMFVGMQSRWDTFNKKILATSQLFRIAVMYSGRKDSEDTFQTVYDDLLKYLVETYGENYTIKDNEVIWNNFMNNNDELKITRDPDDQLVFIWFIAKDQEKIFKDFQAKYDIIKAFGS